MRYYYNFYPKAYMLLYKNAFPYIIEKADVPIGIEFLQLACHVLLDVKVLNVPSKTFDLEIR